MYNIDVLAKLIVRQYKATNYAPTKGQTSELTPSPRTEKAIKTQACRTMYHQSPYQIPECPRLAFIMSRFFFELEAVTVGSALQFDDEGAGWADGVGVTSWYQVDVPYTPMGSLCR